MGCAEAKVEIKCAWNRTATTRMEDMRMKLLETCRDMVVGELKGIDRIRFHGTLLPIAHSSGVRKFMSRVSLLLKDFKGFVEERTARLVGGCRGRAEELGIERIYLRSCHVDKEALAREVAARNGIVVGPICLLEVVEGCMSPMVCGDGKSRRLELRMTPRKCKYLYHYFNHPEYGFGHVRIQTWLPYHVSICLNGRHWLERQLLARGCGFEKDGNCFTRLDDLALAQELMDAQLRSDWDGLLSSLLLSASPGHAAAIAPAPMDYYWSADETEYATDLMFRSAADLERLWPPLMRHAMLVSDSPSVMRFLGKLHPTGPAANEVVSDCRRRYEGARVKHSVNRNSVKMYNKAGSVLRVETTINDTLPFKSFHAPARNPDKPASWRKMRKGVADLHRRCEVSDQCNTRYADALATVNAKEKLMEAVAPECAPATKDGQRFRPLSPWRSDDYQALKFIAQGEHAVNGFRNRDLRLFLFGEPPEDDEKEARRRSGATTRRIRLLRAHGLLRKVPKTNRYVVTEKGQKLATAVLSASSVDIETLVGLAA